MMEGSFLQQDLGDRIVQAMCIRDRSTTRRCYSHRQVRTMSRVWGGTAFAKRSAAMKAPVGLLSGSAVLRKQDGGALPRQTLPQQDHLENSQEFEK